MDRLIAPNTVALAGADTAPVTGTPGYATDGNPASSIPATQWPAYQYNALQEELIAIIAAGNVTPDRTKNNQVLAAIMALIKGTAVPMMNFSQVAALSADQGPIRVIDMGDSLYTWTTSAFFTGYRNVNCGAIPQNMAATPRAWELATIGGTWNTSDPKQARVIAWFQEQGLTIASGSWTPGMGMIASLGSGNWKAPDLRNTFLRMAGTDADTANARPAGTYQADAMQKITGATARFWGVDQVPSDSGVFSAIGLTTGSLNGSGTPSYPSRSYFDSSTVARTSVETRSASTAVSAVILV